MRSFALLMALLASSLVAATPVRAEDGEDEGKPEELEGAKDHPAVKRFPGSIIIGDYLEREFEVGNFPIAQDKVESAEGKYYRAKYVFPKKVSCTQVLRNYEAAFKNSGMKIFKGNEMPEAIASEGHLSGDRWVTGIARTKGGGQTYVVQSCGEWNGGVDVEGTLLVVETQQMVQKVEVATASFMAEEIEKSGRVALYGIQFATGKADITPDSAKALAEIAQLFEDQQDWKLRVEGHTDNVGNSKANLELSKKRAQAVKSWLVTKHQVVAERLTTEGFGDTRPLADNKTDEGRALNRRVELVKR